MKLFNRGKLVANLVLLGALGTGAILMTGCASTTGTKVEVSDASFIQKGKTTRAEVIAKLGLPNVTSRDSSGKEMLIWHHSKSKVDPKSYIPIAGLFLGGGTTEYTEFTVTLDKRGVVVDSSQSNSKVDARLGGG